MENQRDLKFLPLTPENIRVGTILRGRVNRMLYVVEKIEPQGAVTLRHKATGANHRFYPDEIVEHWDLAVDTQQAYAAFLRQAYAGEQAS